MFCRFTWTHTMRFGWAAPAKLKRILLLAFVGPPKHPPTTTSRKAKLRCVVGSQNSNEFCFPLVNFASRIVGPPKYPPQNHGPGRIRVQLFQNHWFPCPNVMVFQAPQLRTRNPAILEEFESNCFKIAGFRVPTSWSSKPHSSGHGIQRF